MMNECQQWPAAAEVAASVAASSSVVPHLHLRAQRGTPRRAFWGTFFAHDVIVASHISPTASPLRICVCARKFVAQFVKSACFSFASLSCCLSLPLSLFLSPSHSSTFGWSLSCDDDADGGICSKEPNNNCAIWFALAVAPLRR